MIGVGLKSATSFESQRETKGFLSHRHLSE